MPLSFGVILTIMVSELWGTVDRIRVGRRDVLARIVADRDAMIRSLKMAVRRRKMGRDLIPLATRHDAKRDGAPEAPRPAVRPNKRSR